LADVFAQSSVASISPGADTVKESFATAVPPAVTAPVKVCVVPHADEVIVPAMTIQTKSMLRRKCTEVTREPFGSRVAA
jgi:hypothetical protein